MIVREVAFTFSLALLLYSFFPEHKTTALILWPLVFTVGWLQWFCRTYLKIPFTLDLLKFAPHARAFTDSIRYMRIPRLLALSLPVFALSFLLVKPCLYLWLPLFLISLPFRKKSPKSPDYEWKFPTEISRFLSPDYPLLRKTYGFKGEKQFELPTAQKPHVIFLFLESFRAKNVGCLGGSPAASPQFDALAEQGVLFTRFYANGLQTFRAMISSLFGIPAHLNTMSLHPFCRIPFIGLPEILKGNGYHTALLQAGYTAFDWTYPFFRKHSFETIIGREDFPTKKKTSWGITDEIFLDFAADWLQKQERPTFLTLFTITNHHPWESPIPFPTPENLPESYRRFLQTFAYTDHCLGLFIEKLKKTGLLEKSVVFIMGDHGQKIGEKGADDFHNDLSEENIHVPLLILGNQKTRIDEPASQVDLLPTVLDLLKIPAIHHSVGRSLLRKEKGTAFFSMPRQEPQMGSIHGDAHSYFQSIEKIYANSAWAPPSLEKIPFEIKAPPNSTDATWAEQIKKMPPSPIIDLSNTLLTDTSIQAIGEKSIDIHELNLSNSPLFTDRSLEWVAEHCPHLSIFNASQCLLVTNQGAAAILNKCPYLRYLNLENNDDITDLPIEKTTYLNALHLKDCRNLPGDALARIVCRCPHLDYLAAHMEKTEDTHLLEMAQSLDQLLYLWLENGTSITDRAFNALINANPRLSILIIENFPHLQQSDFSKKKRINYLKFANCPNLTDATLASLAGQEIETLSLIDCPKITAEGLKNIHPKCKVLIEP